MATFSGKNGKVKVGQDEVAEVTKWTAEEKTEVHKHASSSSAGWKRAVPGTHDISGTVEGKFDNTGTVPFKKGTSLTLVLATDGEASPKGTLTGAAVIESMSFEVDIDSGATVGFVANWQGDGQWTKTGCFAEPA